MRQRVLTNDSELANLKADPAAMPKDESRGSVQAIIDAPGAIPKWLEMIRRATVHRNAGLHV